MIVDTVRADCTPRLRLAVIGFLCTAVMTLASATSIQAQSLSPLRSSPVDKATRTAPTLHKSDADQLLQLDDGGAENAVGFNSDTNNDGTTDQSLGALYFNRFTPPAGDFPLDLQNAQIQFGTLDDDGNVASGGLSAGDVIDIYVWSDPDGDPATGATLEAALTGQSLGTVDATFQTFDFPSAVRIDGPGDILIGFVNRTLPSTPTFPATIDETASQGRSWVAAYADNAGSIAPPENPPVLPADGADDVFAVVGDLNADLAGNWMIRGSYDVVTGSGSQPLSFAPQIGPTNPFDGITRADSAPGFGDLDGDGDLDMALVDFSLSETFAYYENTGSATNPSYVKRTGSDSPLFGFQVRYPEAPSFADVDGDGDLDMLGGAFDNENFAYFENLGSSTNPIFVDRRGDLSPLSDIAFRASDYRNPHFNDIDDDGDVDVVAVSRLSGTFFIENTGTLTTPTFELQTGPDNPFDSIIGFVFTADFDQDGDPDLVASVGDSFLYYENVGSASRPSFQRREGTDNPLDGRLGGFGFTAGDIDGDGDIDIVRNIRQDTPEGGLILFENGGTPLSTVRPAPANPFEGFQLTTIIEDNPVLGDVDGDEDLDLVVGRGGFSRGTAFSYFENTGSSTQPVYVRREGGDDPFDGLSVGSRFDDLTTPELIDLDGDGDLDLASGSSGDGLFYFENLGSATNPIYVSREGSANPFHGLIQGRFDTYPQFIDFDGDSDLDLLLGIRYYENTGSTTSPSFTERTGSSNPFSDVEPSGPFRKPFFTDVDSDGDLDLLTSGGRSNSTFEYFENTGSDSSPTYVRRTGVQDPFVFLGPGAGADAADLDGDGDLDFVSVAPRINEFGNVEGNRLIVYSNGSVQPPLPVELARFTAASSGEAVTLRWSTTSEENNAGFDVERSTDGETFTTIGFEPGVGTTEEAQSYRFVDREAPFATTLFYRLRQVDTDGTFEYSPVVEVEVTPSAVALLPVAPNPVSASARLRYELPEATAVRLQVFDLLGRRVATLADGEQAAGRHEVSWQSAGLASGTYFVRLQAGSTAQTQMLRLVR
jgi:hypothetical protein